MTDLELRLYIALHRLLNHPTPQARTEAGTVLHLAEPAYDAHRSGMPPKAGQVGGGGSFGIVRDPGGRV